MRPFDNPLALTSPSPYITSQALVFTRTVLTFFSQMPTCRKWAFCSLCLVSELNNAHFVHDYGLLVQIPLFKDWSSLKDFNILKFSKPTLRPYKSNRDVTDSQLTLEQQRGAIMSTKEALPCQDVVGVTADLQTEVSIAVVRRRGNRGGWVMPIICLH